MRQAYQNDATSLPESCQNEQNYFNTAKNKKIFNNNIHETKEKSNKKRKTIAVNSNNKF